MVLWVFGYGSLIWKPTFNYDERVVGYITDYRRVFSQCCPTTGRTITLEPQEDAITWGVAYRVTPHVEEQILSNKDEASDVCKMVEFFTSDSQDEAAIRDRVLTYLGIPSDSKFFWYFGPATVHTAFDETYYRKLIQ